MPDKSKSKTKSRKAVSTGIGKPKRKVTGKSELLLGTKEVKEHGGKKNTRSEEIDDLFKDLKRMDSSKEEVWYLCTQTRGKGQHIHYMHTFVCREKLSQNMTHRGQFVGQKMISLERRLLTKGRGRKKDM